MRVMNVIALVLLLLPVLVPATDLFTLLSANFNDKTIDDPIGFGGPDVGEPLSKSASLSAIVRNTPFATPGLEIVRISDGPAGYVLFEFVGSASVDVGNVVVGVDVVFESLDTYYIMIREQGGWGSKFCELYTDPNGNIHLSDAVGPSVYAGTYVAGQPYHFEFLFNTVTDTYDVLQNSVPLIEDRSHGIDGVGIGRIAFKFAYSVLVGAEMSIDNLLIQADEFTAASPSNFSELKPRY
jgi:hypothetical protein